MKKGKVHYLTNWLKKVDFYELAESEKDKKILESSRL